MLVALVKWLLHRIVGRRKPVPPPSPSPSKPAPRAEPVPKPRRDGAPPWYIWLEQESGVKETPGPRSTARIVEYRRLAKVPLEGDDGDVPWCMIAVNAALESCGIPGTRSGLARSVERSPDFIKLRGPALGAIALFWRRSKNSALGHVALYRGETATHVHTLGGNQGDAVCLAPFPKAGSAMGLIGYFWPRSVALPRIGPRAYGGNPVQNVAAD